MDLTEEELDKKTKLVFTEILTLDEKPKLLPVPSNGKTKLKLKIKSKGYDNPLLFP